MADYEYKQLGYHKDDVQSVELSLSNNVLSGRIILQGGESIPIPETDLSSIGYTLPVATLYTLGGVKVAPKQVEQTEYVGIGSDNALVTRPIITVTGVTATVTNGIMTVEISLDNNSSVSGTVDLKSIGYSTFLATDAFPSNTLSIPLSKIATPNGVIPKDYDVIIDKSGCAFKVNTYADGYAQVTCYDKGYYVIEFTTGNSGTLTEAQYNILLNNKNAMILSNGILYKQGAIEKDVRYYSFDLPNSKGYYIQVANVLGKYSWVKGEINLAGSGGGSLYLNTLIFYKDSKHDYKITAKWYSSEQLSIGADEQLFDFLLRINKDGFSGVVEWADLYNDGMSDNEVARSSPLEKIFCSSASERTIHVGFTNSRILQYYNENESPDPQCILENFYSAISATSPILVSMKSVAV